MVQQIVIVGVLGELRSIVLEDMVGLWFALLIEDFRMDLALCLMYLSLMKIHGTT